MKNLVFLNSGIILNIKKRLKLQIFKKQPLTVLNFKTLVVQQLGLSYGDGFNAGQKTRCRQSWPKEKSKIYYKFSTQRKTDH